MRWGRGRKRVAYKIRRSTQPCPFRRLTITGTRLPVRLLQDDLLDPSSVARRPSSPVPPVAVTAHVPEQPLEHPIIDALVGALPHIVVLARPGGRGCPDLLAHAFDDGGGEVRPFVRAFDSFVAAVFEFEDCVVILVKLLQPTGCHVVLHGEWVLVLDADLQG